MDRMLKRATRRNKRRGQRNSGAWRRFSPDGTTCRYCKHDGAQHLCQSGQPHFYRPATEAEKRDPSVMLYRHTLPQGGSVLVRRMVVANHAELITAFCTACAESIGTHQVLCYQRNVGVGEVVGCRPNAREHRHRRLTRRTTPNTKGEVDMRLAAQAKGGFYPTPPRVVDLIAELIHTPSGSYNRGRETLRILDPCCGAGEALAQLAEGLDRPNAIPIETYGVELHRDRAQEAEERLDHALASDLFATSIANGAFGLLLLNPPYDYDSEDKRTEHAFLTHTTRYLADGGLLVFIVPRQRLAVSARYLSTHYGRMRCWAFPDPERQVFDQVVLMGYRKADPVPDAHAEGMALEWAVGEPEPLRSHPYTDYSPETTPSGDILFTTRTVDPVAAAAEARRSGLWASTEITDTLWPARDTRTRPLMPLRRGHMAMLVAAGFLDNLCLEAEGRRILVKGRTSKEMVMVEDSPEKEVHREKLKTTVVALDLHGGEITDIAA